jgi:hypothetical protein
MPFESGTPLPEKSQMTQATNQSPSPSSEPDMPSLESFLGEYAAFVDSRVKWFDDHATNLHHASSGIMGEIIELDEALDRENALEELGDWAFYMVHAQLALKQVSGHKFKLDAPFSHNLPLLAAQNMARSCAGALLDLTKKHWIYNKELNESAVANLLAYLQTIYQMWLFQCDFYGTSPVTILIQNMTKLKKRYPDGYTDAAAQARADKAGQE